MGVYKPLSNAFYDDLIYRTRSQFGTELVEMKQVSQWMVEEQGRAKAVTLAVDQRPLDPKKAWWMEWMGQETAMHFGLEAFARKLTCPWSSSACARLKGKPRGHWEVHYDWITDGPRRGPRALLKATYDRLEAQISPGPRPLALVPHPLEARPPRRGSVEPRRVERRPRPLPASRPPRRHERSPTTRMPRSPSACARAPSRTTSGRPTWSGRMPRCAAP